MKISGSNEDKAFDAISLLVDDRGIDQKIQDALKRRINLHGLTLEVGSPEEPMQFQYPPEHVRRAHLTDGYAHVVFYVSVDDFDRNQEDYIDYVAYHLVMLFAKERYLRKR